MKKIFASVGMVALGVVSVHAMGAADTSKTWSVGGSLRGFYDDNYTTAPKGSEVDSFGVSVSPFIGLSLPMDQTTLALKYTFGAYWYQERQSDDAGNDAWDLTHQFDILLNHAFSERVTFDFMNSFVVAQDPALLDPTGVTTNPYRVEGDNIRNFANAQLNVRLTEKWSSVFGYANTYFNYDNDNSANETSFGPTGVASLSGINDRMEQTFLLNLRWQMLQETVGVLGYNFAMTDYLSDEFIGYYAPAPFDVPADYRNSRSHFLYVGADHNFNQQLSLSVRLGAQDADFYNDPTSDTDITPYGDLSLNYIYRAGSSLRVGVTHQRSHTDVVDINQGTTVNALTSDQEVTVIYGNLNHALTPRLTGNLGGSWQNSSFNGGSFDSEKEQFYTLSAGLSYRFSRHFTGDVGYAYTTLSSDIPGRDYDRNYVYLGVSVLY